MNMFLVRTATPEEMLKEFMTNPLTFLYKQAHQLKYKVCTISYLINEINGLPLKVKESLKDANTIYNHLSTLGKRRFSSIHNQLERMVRIEQERSQTITTTIKSFKTIEEAKAYGKNFGKYQYEMVLVDGKKKILCGTDMVYEEAIWGNVYDIIKTMYDKFTTPEMLEEKDDDECMLVDETSEVRDHIIEWFEKTMDVEFITVYDEY